MSQLIVFAGLPGTGKTTLATRLAAQLDDAVLLNKDEIRAKLFEPMHIEYSARQNDFCMEALYHLAGYHLSHYPSRSVIVDGRTYARDEQVARLKEHLARWKCRFRVIECRCEREVLLQRISQDAGKHPASDRTVEKVVELLALAQPLKIERCTIDTDQENLQAHLAQIQQYLQ